MVEWSNPAGGRACRDHGLRPGLVEPVETTDRGLVVPAGWSSPSRPRDTRWWSRAGGRARRNRGMRRSGGRACRDHRTRGGGASAGGRARRDHGMRAGGPGRVVEPVGTTGSRVVEPVGWSRRVVELVETTGSRVVELSGWSGPAGWSRRVIELVETTDCGLVVLVGWSSSSRPRTAGWWCWSGGRACRDHGLRAGGSRPGGRACRDHGLRVPGGRARRDHEGGFALWVRGLWSVVVVPWRVLSGRGTVGGWS